MKKKHKASQCDHIVKIAEDNKYYDWKNVWSANKALQNSKGRKNPLLLFTGDNGWRGDSIKLPPKGPPPFKQPLDQDGVYKVPKKQLLCLRLRILKSDFSSVKDSPFELIVEGGKTYKGKTTAKGRLQIGGKDPEIPNSCTKATLSVRVSPENAKEGSQQGGGGDQAEKKESALTGDFNLMWTLQIGKLNPINEKAHSKYCISGVQQRLNNLGFASGAVDGRKGPNTKLAIEKFQSLFGLTVDNIPDIKETQPKFKEVHDSDKPVTIPGGDKEATRTIVRKSRVRETKVDDIGHVAPDFIDSDDPFVNTFVLKPEYRISIKLGDIENLFPWAITTKAGRLARLQVLGLFYWPLNHRVAAGLTAKPATPARLADNGAAYDFIWGYFKSTFCGGGDDAAAEGELETRLTEWVVQKFNAAGHGDGGELPLAVDTDEEGEPSAAADRAQGHYAKIRLPGGWCFLQTSGFEHNKDTSVNGMKMYDSKYDFEGTCYTANQVLGKIPLIAKVEKRIPSKDEWQPAPDVQVNFQLLRPYDLPAFEAGDDKLNTQPNRPSLREGSYSVTNPIPPTRADVTCGGPSYFAHKWNNYNLNKDNPQVDNCHHDCGGKRRSGEQANVGDSIFKLGEVDGFSKAHGNPPANIESDGAQRVINPAPVLFKKVEASGHSHAVKTKTNDEGEAGVIFMPSRCAGDRYRIRAYVRPIAQDGSLSNDPGSDGKGMNAVRVDTGTFVTWRNIRISKFVRQELTLAGLNDVMANQFVNSQIQQDNVWRAAQIPVLAPLLAFADGTVQSDAEKEIWMEEFCAVDTANAWAGLPYGDVAIDDLKDNVMNTVSNGAVGDEFDGFRAAFARAFCEFEEDPDFAKNLTQVDWDDAVQCGLGDARAGLAAMNNARVTALFDTNDGLNKLFFREAGNTDGITVSNGFIFPARTAAAFDASVPGIYLTGANAHVWKNFISNTIYCGYLLPGFMRKIAENGYLPGIALVQSLMSSNLGMEPGFDLGFSGLGTQYRGAFIYYGKAAYADNIGDQTPLDTYGFTANTTHEMGHLLFSVHAPGHNGAPGGIAGGAETERHDCHHLLVDNTDTFNNSVVSPPPAPPPVNNEPAHNPAYGTCLMSYRRCEGQFCSRCLAQLRGCKILSATMRACDAAPAPLLAAVDPPPATPPPLPWKSGGANLLPVLLPVERKWGNEGQELNFTLTGTAVRGLALAFTIDNLPDGAVLTNIGDGTAKFTWTPAVGKTGTYTGLVTVTEGAGPNQVKSDDALLVITVLA